MKRADLCLKANKSFMDMLKGIFTIKYHQGLNGTMLDDEDYNDLKDALSWVRILLHNFYHDIFVFQTFYKYLTFRKDLQLLA